MISIVTAIRAQLCGLGASAFFGSIPGLMFVVGSYRAWQLTYATFLWSLIAGLVVIFAAFISGRVAYGRWRRGLVLSSVVFFSHTTIYLLVLVALALLAPAPEIGRLAPAPTLLARVAPVLYACSAAMVLFSGPLFFRWTRRG